MRRSCHAESVTMEAYVMPSCSPSTQIIMNSQELEDGVAGVGLKSRARQVSRIAFEEYLDIWMKIATTNPELLMASESLDEFIKYTERCAVHYGSTSDEKDRLVQAQRNIPVKKLSKKITQAKHTRVERMRRLYMQCRAPELLIPQRPGPVLGSDGQENWEQEMDELVKWTHTLSSEELDDL